MSKAREYIELMSEKAEELDKFKGKDGVTYKLIHNPNQTKVNYDIVGQDKSGKGLIKSFELEGEAKEFFVNLEKKEE